MKRTKRRNKKGQVQKEKVPLQGLLGLGLRSLTCLVCNVLLVSSKDVIPPPERGREVVGEGHVMVIVVLSARPARQPVVSRPREIVPGMSLHSLEQTQGHPGKGGDKVKVAGGIAPHEGASNGTGSEDHDFNGMGVFCSEAEGRRPFVVQLVDVLVEGTVVKTAMSPVMEEVLEHEEQEDLERHLLTIMS